MAVRTANVYHLGTTLAVLGPNIPTKWVDWGHPTDRYPEADEIYLSENARQYQEATENLKPYKGAPKRVHADRFEPLKSEESKKKVLASLATKATECQDALISVCKVFGVRHAVEGVRAAAGLCHVLYHCSLGDDLAKFLPTSEALIALLALPNIHVYPGGPTEILSEIIQDIAVRRMVAPFYLAAERCKNLIALAHRSAPRGRRQIPIDDRMHSAKEMRFRHIRRYIIEQVWSEPSDDAMWDLALRMPVTSSLTDLETERRRAIRDFDLERAITIEETADKSIQRLHDVSVVAKHVGAFRYPGFETCLSTVDGVAFISGGYATLATIQDLTLVVELLQEVAGTALSMHMEFGEDTCKSYISGIMSMYTQLMVMDSDTANIMPCLHRDLEVAVRQTTYLSFSLDGTFTTSDSAKREIYKKYGIPPDMFLRCPESVPLATWVRSFRPVPQTRFPAVGVSAEVYRVTHMVTEPDGESLENLKIAIRVVMAHAHKITHGAYPTPVQAYIDELVATGARDPDEPFDLDDAAAITLNGSASFDYSAAVVRDKSNVPFSAATCRSAAEATRIPFEDRREILYWAHRDWKEATRTDISAIARGEYSSYPDLTTDKPENKEFSRAVTQEEATRRKTNSLIQNNLMPLASALPGSMLSASNRKKHEVLRSLGSMGSDAREKGDILVYLYTDFTKFGHSIHPSTQTAMLEVVAEYYDEPWIANFGKAVEHKVIVSHRLGHLISWVNSTGADGQGMRNSLWQIMLAAYPLAIHPQLRAAGTDLVANEPIRVVWFEDDHVFPIRLSVPKELQKQIPASGYDRPGEELMEHICKNMGTLEHIITTMYTQRGLKMELSKNDRMLAGGALIGEHFDFRGPVRNPLKASNRCLVEPESRIPSITDYMSSSTSTLSGAASDGMDPLKAYALAVWCASWRMTSYYYDVCLRYQAEMCLMALAPTSFGGLGFPLITNFLAVSGPKIIIEFVYCAMCLSESVGPYKSPATNLLGAMAKAADRIYSAHEMTVHPLVAPPSGFREVPRLARSATLGVMRVYIPDINRYEAAKEHFKSWVLAVAACYEEVPFTNLSALRQAHPLAWYTAEIDKLTTSATAAGLLGDTALRNLRRNQKSGDNKTMLHNLHRLRDTARVRIPAFWEDVLSMVRTRSESFAVLAPSLVPFKFYVAEDGDIEREYSFIVRPLKEGEQSAPLVSSSGVSTFANFSRVWMRPDVACLAGAVDLLASTEQCTTHDTDLLARALSAAWSGVDIAQFANLGVTQSPYRDISSVAYYPSDQVTTVKALTRDRYVDTHSIDSIKPQLPQDMHMSLPHASMCCLLWNRATGAYHFHPMGFMIWKEPEIKLRRDTFFMPAPFFTDTARDMLEQRLPEDAREFEDVEVKQSTKVRGLVNTMHRYVLREKKRVKQEYKESESRQAIRDIVSLDEYFEFTKAKVIEAEVSPKLVFTVLAELHTRLMMDIGEVEHLRQAYRMVVNGSRWADLPATLRAVWKPTEETIDITVRAFPSVGEKLEAYCRELFAGATSSFSTAKEMTKLVGDVVTVAHRHWAECLTLADSYMVFNDEPDFLTDEYQRYLQGWASRYKEQYVGVADLIKKRKHHIQHKQNGGMSLAKSKLDQVDPALASLYVVNIYVQFKVVVLQSLVKVHAKAMSEQLDPEAAESLMRNSTIKMIGRCASKLLTKHLVDFKDMGTSDVAWRFEECGLHGISDALTTADSHLGIFFRTVAGGVLGDENAVSHETYMRDTFSKVDRFRKLSPKDMRSVKSAIKEGADPPRNLKAYPAYLRDMVAKLRFGVTPPRPIGPDDRQPGGRPAGSTVTRQPKGIISRTRRAVRETIENVTRVQAHYTAERFDSRPSSAHSDSSPGLSITDIFTDPGSDDEAPALSVTHSLPVVEEIEEKVETVEPPDEIGFQLGVGVQFTLDAGGDEFSLGINMGATRGDGGFHMEDYYD
jgi:hypothetical protein